MHCIRMHTCVIAACVHANILVSTLVGQERTLHIVVSKSCNKMCVHASAQQGTDKKQP